jgi:hypothetical protein
LTFVLIELFSVLRPRYQILYPRKGWTQVILRFVMKRSKLHTVSLISGLGQVFAIIGLLWSAASSYGLKGSPIFASIAIQGKPSLEETMRMQFKDSVRNDSIEKHRISKRKLNQRAVVIKANASDCLVSTIGEKTCLITVENFNKRITSSTGKTNFSDSFRNTPDSIASLRGSLLSDEISDSFTSFLSATKTANPYMEDVDIAWKRELAQQEEKIGKQKLNTIYKDYLFILNQSHISQALVIGSSDSASLDSLIKRSFDSTWRESRQVKQANLPEETRPIWSTVKLELLPPEFTLTFDTLPSDVLSPIQKTKIGWFSGMIHRSSHLLVSYSDALPLLIEVALQGGSIQKTLLKYGPGQDAKRTQLDSMPIKIWLTPNEILRSGRNVTGLKAIDTSRLKPTEAFFSDLPWKMKRDIARIAANKESVIYSNAIGRWFFQFDAPWPLSNHIDLRTSDSDEQNYMATALNAFQSDIRAKNNERKMALYQTYAGNSDFALTPTLKDGWMKKYLEINWTLINQTP